MTTSAAPPLPPATPLVPPRRTPIPRDAFAAGLAFHRLVFARRRTGWWTPLVVGVLGLALYAAMLAVIIVAVIVAALLDPELAADLQVAALEATFDLTNPLIVALLLGTIVLMLPAYVLASLIVNGPRLGLVSSAAGRIRWRWMLLCAAAAATVAVVLTGVSFLLPSDVDDAAAGAIVAPADNPQFLWTLVVLLVLVPLQSAAEEYIFRGYLQQAIGRWLRHPAFAILLPVPLFVLGHAYDPLGQAGVAVFAIAAGWLTWRTGGLEAGIALHVVNNLVAFLLSLAGLSDVNATSPGVVSFIWSFVLIGAYVGLVELLFRRSPHHRTLRLTLPAAPMPPYVAPLPGA